MRRLWLRDLSGEERAAIERLAPSRTAPARQVERARIIWRASQGEMAPAIAAAPGTDGLHRARLDQALQHAGLGRAGGSAACRPTSNPHP